MNLIKKYQFEISALFVFIVYLTTTAPGIIQIDSGELSAVASTLGIAHPSGYPLFTILGFLFTKILFFLPPIYALNIFAAVNTTVGYYFIVKLIFELFVKFNTGSIPESKTSGRKKDIKSKAKALPVLMDKEVLGIISMAAGMTIAFFRTFWMQATSIEVYSLHVSLISITLFCFVKAINTEEYKLNPPFIKQKYHILFALFLGLSFTNHLTTILLLPGIFYLYIRTYSINKNSLLRVVKMQIPFLSALLIYLYLPLRALSNPEINWGNPTTWAAFKRQFMGWQYQSWIFSSTEAASKQFNYFINNLPGQFAFISLAFILLGVFYWFSKEKKYMVFVLILFITCLLYSINYDISDIDSYFLLAYIALGIFITPALIFIYNYFGFAAGSRNLLFAFFILPLLTLTLNYSDSNESDNKHIEQFSRAMMNSLEPDAFVMSYIWDFFVSPSYYLQHVEGIKKDAAIIDKELVKRSWYFNQIKRNHPEVYSTIENKLDSFLPELEKFERNLDYDGNLLEMKYRDILQDMILKNFGKKVVYLTPEVVTNEVTNKVLIIPDSLELIPDMLSFRLVKRDSSYYECKLPDFEIQFPEKEDYYVATVKNLISTSFSNRAIYEFRFGKLDRARTFIKKAQNINPTIEIPDILKNLTN